MASFVHAIYWSWTRERLLRLCVCLCFFLCQIEIRYETPQCVTWKECLVQRKIRIYFHCIHLFSLLRAHERQNKHTPRLLCLGCVVWPTVEKAKRKQKKKKWDMWARALPSTKGNRCTPIAQRTYGYKDYARKKCVVWRNEKKKHSNSFNKKER